MRKTGRAKEEEERVGNFVGSFNWNICLFQLICCLRYIFELCHEIYV